MNWNMSQYVIDGESEKEFGRFVLEPMPRGMAALAGNALRRQILFAVPGSAIKGVAIEGIVHEFSTLPGLYEDIPDFILNLREIIFRLTGVSEATARLEVRGEKDVRAGDLILPLGVEVLNPDYYLCRLSRDSHLNAELFITNGRGFVPEEENKDPNLPITTIYVNSNFSPIRRVAFRTEAFESDDSQERLILDVKTNGSVSPELAMKIGAVYLEKVFGIMKEFEENDFSPVTDEETVSDSTPGQRPLQDLPVAELGLSRRSSNCLKSGDINTVGQLVAMSKGNLMKLKNFGRKSLDEIREKLLEHGLALLNDDEDFEPAADEEEDSDET
ncbi:MAG: DNA-directed RNA polymerase subunit alpha [Candidatus Wallbacteria bacterium]|nr:DNA-directed RNA polymerase subunit alpha [Candidatus Wallbacteria bacterium]